MKRLLLIPLGIFLISLSSTFAQSEKAPDIADLTKKAQSGDANAEALLGKCYATGSGVEKNIPLGLDWTLRAAQHGNSSSQAIIGFAYLEGFGNLNKNPEEGVKWLTLSANNQCAIAQRGLGECYMNGTGVDKNEKIALEYLTKSAIGGDDRAQLKLSEIYRQGTLLPEDKKQSFEWAQRSALQGNLIALMKIAAYYGKGYYVPKDSAKSFQYQLLAAQKGSIGAAYIIGGIYADKNGDKQDSTEALKWFKVAAYGGLIEAQKTLIYIYAKGDGVPKDYIESLAWMYILGSNGNNADKEKINNIENMMAADSVIKAQERARNIQAEINRTNPSYKLQSFCENMGIPDEPNVKKEDSNFGSSELKMAKVYYYSNLKEFTKDGKVIPFIEVKDKILKTLENH